MRLDKLLAHAGYGTRKEVRQLIKNRLVMVDNTYTTNPGMKINPVEQEVIVNGKRVKYEKYVYLMLHKPPGYVSATIDHMYPTVLELVPEEFAHYKLFPVGRLDIDTEGLLLLTNDGKMNHILTSPRQNVVKTYYVKVNGIIERKHIEKFKQGIMLDDGYVTKPADLEVIKSDTVSVGFLSISEGKYHQVKRMFRALGMEVIYLKRIRMGEIVLDESLEKGEVRPLTEKEKEYLQSLK